MISLSLIDVLPFLLLAARWTLLLSVIAFAGGAAGATLLLLWRYGAPKVGRRATTIYIQFFQGTPLLLLDLLLGVLFQPFADELGVLGFIVGHRVSFHLGFGST